jgi:signal transduction histidine kinase
MSIVAVAVAALMLFAVPLAAGASTLLRNETTTRLARDANRLSGEVAAQVAAGGSDLALPHEHHDRVRLALYDARGVRLAGDGPDRSGLSARAAQQDGQQQELRDGELSVSVPANLGRQMGSVRAAIDYHTVLTRLWTLWAVMAMLAAAVVGLAWVLARRQSARIARPLEEFAGATRALGTGDFSVRAARSGLREVDDAAVALEATARRLGGLLERERSFSADAAHQVRTPLTALRLGLESALLDPDRDLRDTVEVALRRVDRVEATVEELLDRARDTLAPTAPVDLSQELGTARDLRWTALARHASRPLVVTAEDDLPLALGSAPVVHQVLDVLVSNALQHGSGTVAVTARRAPDGVAVDVTDQGPGFDKAALRTAFVRRAGGTTDGADGGAAGNGIGLALARDLAEAGGARLVVAHPGPGPVVTLVLPPAAPPAVPPSTGGWDSGEPR